MSLWVQSVGLDHSFTAGKLLVCRQVRRGAPVIRIGFLPLHTSLARSHSLPRSIMGVVKTCLLSLDARGQALGLVFVHD